MTSRIIPGQYDLPNPFLVLVGAPGSGKSTWARQHFTRTEIVSSDALRAQIGDHSGDQRANRWVFEARDAIVAGRVHLGKTVVVDSTNRTPEEREKAALSAVRWGRPAFLVVFLTPLEVCLERNARRRKPRRVPEDWVIETHRMIEKDLDPATTWFPRATSGALFVRHERHGYVTGALTMRRYSQDAWLDCAREDPPAWFAGPGKWGEYHEAGWALRNQL